MNSITIKQLQKQTAASLKALMPCEITSDGEAVGVIVPSVSTSQLSVIEKPKLVVPVVRTSGVLPYDKKLQAQRQGFNQ